MSETSTSSMTPAARWKTLDSAGQPVLDLTTATLADLETRLIDFGKLHKGKSYRQVIQEFPDWVSWFLSHYQDSPKSEHRHIAHFTELWMDHLERDEWDLMMDPSEPSPEGPKPHPAPKAKTMAKSSISPPRKGYPIKPATPANPPPPEDLSQDVSALQTRMLRVEEVLSQILSHVQQQSGPAAS